MWGGDLVASLLTSWKGGDMKTEKGDFMPLSPVLSIADLPSRAPVRSACYVHETERVYVMTPHDWVPLELYDEDDPKGRYGRDGGALPKPFGFEGVQPVRRRGVWSDY